jgi:metallo-beta-lactamase class B
MLMLSTLANAQTVVLDPDLEVERLRNNLYLHRSWVQVEGFGRVECNGLVYLSGGEVMVVDSPPDDRLSEVLIGWAEGTLGARVVGLVVGHFHGDSMGGIGAFAKAGATTYSSVRCQEIAERKGLPVPRVGFGSTLEVRLGEQRVVCGYFGAGHSPDNVVTYVPEHQVLFGGCLIKAAGADKGNLGDADVTAWTETVQKVKQAYPEANIIVPGHGPIGDRSLLDYTADMFGP